MENCTVKTFKGNINNDNLPIIGKVVIKVSHVDSPTTRQKYTFFRAGSNPCHVKFINTYYETLGTTEFTMNANANRYGNIDLSSNNISIIIDAYNIAVINVNQGYEYVGFDYLMHNSNFIGIWTNNSVIFEKLKNFSTLKAVECSGGVIGANYEDIVLSNPNLLYISSNYRMEASLLPSNTKLQYIKLRGNLSGFPTSLKWLYISGNGITGSVTEYVVKLRAAGRTTGKIQIPNFGNNNNITIDDGNGNEIGAKTFLTNKGMTSKEKLYLVWTENSVDITEDATGRETYESLTTVTVNS
jgi:hypothetical protein